LPETLPRRVDSAVPIATAASPLPAMSVSLADPLVTEREVKPAVVKSLDAERYKVQCTVTRSTFEKLRRVQDLMRHTCSNGDVGLVFDRALETCCSNILSGRNWLRCRDHASREVRPRDHGTSRQQFDVPSGNGTRGSAHLRAHEADAPSAA